MKQKILKYIEDNLEASPKEISYALGCSRQLVHRYLGQLLDAGLVSKIGKPPLVFYQFNSQQIYVVSEDFAEYGSLDFIEITVDGRYLKGIEAFKYWCEIRNQPFEKTLKEYKLTLKKYHQFVSNGYIDGTKKLTGTKGFTEFGLYKLLYLDFYAIERFGKTTLGKLIHFGKQSQSRKLINEIIEMSKPTVQSIIKEFKVDAVGYIPPTLPREIQIMAELERGFGLKLPHIKITKVKGDIVVPQKALSKIRDRIMNTKMSIVVRENNTFNTVLLIDDAVGSGATLNETALKIVKKGIAKKVIGLAITGSYKGFEVLTEA